MNSSTSITSSGQAIDGNYRVGEMATFIYHNTLRIGEVVEVAKTYVKLKHGDNTYRSYLYNKIQGF